MEKQLTGKSGISIKILTQKIKKEMKKNNEKKKHKRTVKNSFEKGKISTSDWKNINLGIDILGRILNQGLDKQFLQMTSGQNDVSKIKKDVYNYKEIIIDVLRRISILSKDEYEMHKRIEQLEEFSQIAQAARDGIIIKQEKRIEIIDGIAKDVIYDTSMTPKEIQSILYDYQRDADRLMIDKLNNYLELGLATAGTIGTFAHTKKEESNDGMLELVTVGSVAIGAIQLFKGILKSEDREKQWELKDLEHRMGRDILENEQISKSAETKNIENIKLVVEKERELTNKIENKRLSFDLIIDIVSAIISGMYINSQIEFKENGKIDGKTLAKALVNLQNAKSTVQHILSSGRGVANSKKEQEDFNELCKKVKAIMDQMDEKVYPLEGANKPFNSIKISNFKGKFYPKKNYETGEINYSTTIQVPEFSMKRGDIVLLSGESGTGKSTFLRLLKRGDINNRKPIELDNGEKVDNLGNEYISFKPNINLGDETSVLHQITGKWSISELTDEERNNLQTILRELKFNTPNLLEELASKKYMEFSTGQQRRLALSKVFYRINDGTSVIIVDEPVGNVEDSLIREQLEMIKKYAENRNVMLLLTTHRLDLAEDLVTKKYNINNEGILEQIPIKKKEEKGEER